MGVQVAATRIASFEEAGRVWRALEESARDPSFFQSWTWVGCLAEERYDDPLLLRAESGGRVVGLALFNRRRGRLHLTASGEARLDAPFIEHNAPLLAAGEEAAALPALMGEAWRIAGARGLVFAGVPPAALRAAGGVAFRLREEPAPYVDLDAVRAAGRDWFTTLSANTRYQLRRSARCLSRSGELRIERAETEAQALEWLGALAALHGESWRRRGHPGAFADPFSLRFHHALVARAQERRELDLLRLSAGGETFGYLYNLRQGGRVYAYQSGLDHGRAGRHGKPGLTFHALAVGRALAAGDRVYDFLAGAARYKSSLANASVPLLWAEAVPRWSVRGLAARLLRRNPAQPGQQPREG